MFIYIPSRANYIIVDVTGEIYANKAIVGGSILMLGMSQLELKEPKIIRLITIIKNHDRFLTKELEVVTNIGRPYNEIILENLVLDDVIKNNIDDNSDEIPF